MNTRLFGLLAALVMLSCSTNDRNSALSVTSVVMGTFAAGTTPTSGGTCTFSATSQETEFPVFAANAPNSLGASGFVVKNQLVSTTTVNKAFNGDTTTFSPHQAVVDYEIVGGATLPQQTIPVSGSPMSSGTSQAVIVPLFLPTAILQAMQALPNGGAVVRATTRIEGRLDDGTTVTTSEHEFVVVVQTGAAAVGTPCF
jgi:hypothetical protein